MMFIGHFSFDEIGLKDEVRHGYICCVIDSDTAEEAVEKFKWYLIGQKKDDPAFSSIVNIYVEDIISIEKVPTTPVMTRLQSAAGQFPKSVSYSLPSVNIPGIEAFGWAQDIKEQEAGSEEYQDAIPFIEFEKLAYF